MEFEDRLRGAFRQADRSIQAERLEYVAALDRGKRLRLTRFATVAAAAAVLVGGTFVGANVINGGQPPITPVGPEETETNFTDDPTPPPPGDKGECSAARDAHDVSAQPEVPQTVLGVRMRIVEEAWACDFDGLEELTGTPFNYDNGGKSEGAGAYWRGLEEEKDPITKVLVRLLDTTPAVVEGLSGTVYVWPAAAASDDPTDEQWAEVEEVFEGTYIPEYIDNLRRLGYYNGNRIEITEDGEWTTFALGLAAAVEVTESVEVTAPSRAGSSFEPGKSSGSCSGAQDAHTGYEQPDLPNKVNEVRRDIIVRTWTCDYEGLEEIALFDNDPPFSFKVTREKARPSEYWKRLEEQGQPVLADLVETLEKVPTRIRRGDGVPDVYVWPGAGSGMGSSEYQVVIDELGDWQRFLHPESSD